MQKNVQKYPLRKKSKNFPAEILAGNLAEKRAGIFPEEKLKDFLHKFLQENVQKNVQEYSLRKKSQNFPAEISAGKRAKVGAQKYLYRILQENVQKNVQEYPLRQNFSAEILAGNVQDIP